MNAGFWIKLLPAASVYKCEPAKAERIQAGTSGQLGARLEANNESFEAFCCFRLVCGS